MTPRELLIHGAEELGVPLGIEQVNSLFLYTAELKKWNRRINLTAITSDRDVVVKHLLDSLAFLVAGRPGAGDRLLDMGSGAGFPAIPIRIACPAVSVTLVESVKKKASFLRHMLRTLPLHGAEVLDLRTGEVPAHYEYTYTWVTARAFAGMAAAVAEGTRFLKQGGLMVLSRGPEETIGDEDLRRAGVSLVGRKALRLPHSDYDRAIWVFRRD